MLESSRTGRNVPSGNGKPIADEEEVQGKYMCSSSMASFNAGSDLLG